ncbi:MAG: YfhO family protein [Oscillospiraceae bacterium]|nr:YfhO family protein [Oscillospiraceae bacterium]
MKTPLNLNLNVKSFLFNKRLYIFAFFIPMIVLLTSYLIFGLYPVKDQSVLVLDLNGQYVYYFENLRDAFWGNGSLVNSWSRNFSGETMGMFAYYLASPFTIVVMLLPRSIITESLLIMQMLKVGTASVTFCWYLRNSRNISPYNSLMFSIMYSLMAYMIVQLMDPMWLDGLVYLPIICMGIERLVDKSEWLMFIITLALMFIANFYIGWMIAIFCCFYFLAYYFFISEDTMPFSVKDFILSGVKFAVGGIISAICSAWLLIPLYYSLSLGKFTFTTPKYDMKAQFDIIDFFVNLLPNVYDTCRPEGSPVVYCGVLTILLIPLYFFNSNIKFRQKLGCGLLCVTIILSMYMSTVDLVWHGFQVPNWLPYRYSFTFSFIMLIMAAQALERIEGVSFKEIGGAFFLLAAYAIYVDKQDIIVTANGKDIEKTHLLLTIWFTVGLSAVYALLLYLHKKHYRVKPIPIIMTVFIVAELTVSTTFTMKEINRDVVYSKHSSYNRYITLGRNTVEKIYDMDDGVYRIEKNFHRTVNDAMAFGSFGVSHSSSTLNSAPIQFLRNMGFSYGGHYIKYRGATYVTDALFGIKYVMEKGTVPQKKEKSDQSDDAEESAELEEETEEDLTPEVAKSVHYDDLVLANGDSKEIMYVYKNPYALPVAFMADSSIADLSFTSWENPFENQNMLLSAMLSGNDDLEFFKRITIDRIVPENAKPSAYGNHSKYVPRIEGQNSHIEFLFDAPTDDMIYMFFPSSYERKINLWLNEEFVDYYYEGGNMTIMPLGRFSPGEEISLITTIREEKNEVLFKENYIYYLDQKMFEDAVDELSRQPLEITSFKEDHIKGTVTAEKDGILFTTLSWEPGWTIYVDGKRTAPVKLVDALIGVPVSEGTHTIEMKFFPKGMAMGIFLSIMGIGTLVIIGLNERKNKKAMLNRIYEVE